MTIQHNVEQAPTSVSVLSSSRQAPLHHIRKIRLMLLGSPPDMVHGIELRKTHLSTESGTRGDTAAALDR